MAADHGVPAAADTGGNRSSNPRSNPGSSAARLPLTERLIMALGGASVALAMVALLPVLPQIDAELAHRPGDHLLVKLLVTVIGLTMVVGAPLAGFLADRIGTRRVLLVASLAYAVAGSSGLYLSSLPLLMASRLVVGLAAGAIAACSMTLINSRLEGLARARWMGAHVAVGAFAGMLVHPLAGYLGEFGWRWPFALYVFGFGLAALGALSRDPVRAPAPGSAPADAAPLLSWLPVRYVVLAFFIGCTTYLPAVYVPFILRGAGVTSPLVISLVGLCDAILTCVMAMLFARSQRHLSSTGAFAFSFACVGTGLAIAASWPTFAGVMTGMAVFGFGLGWYVPNLMTAAAAVVGPTQQGRTVGFVKAAHYLAAPGSVILVEPLTRRFGPTSAMIAAAALAFAMLAVFAVMLLGQKARAASSSGAAARSPA